jgi:hypothetical protein
MERNTGAITSAATAVALINAGFHGRSRSNRVTRQRVCVTGTAVMSEEKWATVLVRAVAAWFRAGAEGAKPAVNNIGLLECERVELQNRGSRQAFLPMMPR